MAKPNSRQGLIDYALRRLGEPVTKINVDDSQIQDRVDDAIQYFQEYHDDGIDRNILKHQVTSDDAQFGATSGYLEFDVDDNITAVINVFPFADGFANNFFDAKYQFVLNDLYNWGDLDLVGYDMKRQYFNLLDSMLNQPTMYEFKRVKNKLRVYLNTNGVAEGMYIIFEVYQILDPNTYSEIYNSILLKQYVTALIKKQWGMNLSKFDNVQMPGGITFNGQQIYQDANEEVVRIEEEIQKKYELPPMGFME